MRILRRSHILPDFLYRSIYDDQHKLQVLTALPDQPDHKKQSGYWEWLLCGRCETKLSRWERYAANLLEGGLPAVNYSRNGNLIWVSGIDYSRFRLFQLSLLWRAGVSRQDFFAKVQLGMAAEGIHPLLLEESTGAPEQFPCLMFGVTFQGQAMTQVVVQPTLVKSYGSDMVRFVCGGFLWSFFLDGAGLPDALRTAYLQPSGTLCIHVGTAETLPDLASFAESRAALR